MNKYLAKTKGKFCSSTERREQQRYSSIQVFFCRIFQVQPDKGVCIQNMKKTKNTRSRKQVKNNCLFFNRLLGRSRNKSLMQILNNNQRKNIRIEKLAWKKDFNFF